MPSVKNPNGPSKNRIAARRSSARKTRRQRSEHAKNKISHIDTQRGARPGLLPNSGPGAALSSKKARKVEKALKHAMKRRMEAEGEVEMKGMLLRDVLGLGQVADGFRCAGGEA